MMAYGLLGLAVVCEVAGTMLLPLTQSFTKPLPVMGVVLAYGLAFYLLAVVSTQLPLAIIYASWAGLGVFSVAILSAYFYGQVLSPPAVVGLILIVVGVALVNVYRPS